MAEHALERLWDALDAQGPADTLPVHLAWQAGQAEREALPEAAGAAPHLIDVVLGSCTAVDADHHRATFDCGLRGVVDAYYWPTAPSVADSFPVRFASEGLEPWTRTNAAAGGVQRLYWFDVPSQQLRWVPWPLDGTSPTVRGSLFPSGFGFQDLLGVDGEGTVWVSLFRATDFLVYLMAIPAGGTGTPSTPVAISLPARGVYYNSSGHASDWTPWACGVDRTPGAGGVFAAFPNGSSTYALVGASGQHRTFDLWLDYYYSADPRTTGWTLLGSEQMGAGELSDDAAGNVSQDDTLYGYTWPSNSIIGGLDPLLVRWNLRSAVRQIWFGTLTAAQAAAGWGTAGARALLQTAYTGAVTDQFRVVGGVPTVTDDGPYTWPFGPRGLLGGPALTSFPLVASAPNGGYYTRGMLLGLGLRDDGTVAALGASQNDPTALDGDGNYGVYLTQDAAGGIWTLLSGGPTLAHYGFFNNNGLIAADSTLTHLLIGEGAVLSDPGRAAFAAIWASTDGGLTWLNVTSTSPVTRTDLGNQAAHIATIAT